MMTDHVEAATDRSDASDLDRIDRDVEVRVLRRRLEREQEARRLAEQIVGDGFVEVLREQREVMLLARVAVATNEASVLGPAVTECLSLVARHLGWPVATMWLRRGDDPRLFPTGHWYRDPCYTGAALADAVAARLSAPTGSLPDTVAANGVPEWLEGLKARTNWLSGQHDDELGVATALAVPVWSGNEVIGVAAFFTDEAAPVEPHTMELVEQVVTQLGAAVGRLAIDGEAGDPTVAAGVAESLGAVAHHVRTPLNGLIGNLELLCDGGLSADAKDLASRALQSAIDLHRQFERWLVDADTSTR
jgi:signal transduction histidine kinase